MDEKGKVYEIHGSVRGRKNEPLYGARVVVWWQHIRQRKKLASGETSEQGRFHLKYKVPKNVPLPLLLVVEARSEHLDAPLVSPLTQAQPALEINLNLEVPDQSEWATLMASIKPLLGRLKLSELAEDATHQDISFLARELSKSTEVVMRVAISARLEAAFKIPAPAFYAFLRQRVPASLPSPLLDASQNFTAIAALVQSIGSLIFALSAGVQQSTLTAAVALDLIGAQFTPLIPDFVKQLQAARTIDLLNQPYLGGNATLGQLLDVVALPAAKQQAFSQALAANTQSMSVFWATLGDGQHGFTAAEAAAIEQALSVGAFVTNSLPLVQTLVQRFTDGTYKTLADLARLSAQDWVQLVDQTGPPPGIDATATATPAEVFAQAVYTSVTQAFPTTALTSRIAAGNFVPPAQQQPLIQFFQNNPSLELLTDSVPAYLAAQGDQAFAGISREDQAAVVANVRSFQRVVRVAPNPDVAQTVLGLGITSATQIASVGQQQFVVQATAAGLAEPDAIQVYQAAAQTYASAVSLYMEMNNGPVGLWPKAMGDVPYRDKITQDAIKRDQSLATLFGSQDYCATDDCTSVLSPAAYLCDLLMWLRNHKNQQGGKTALDVLDERRPDIRHLLLNCPNTDTELPYIDLVNELLADKISPPPTADTALALAITTPSQNSISVASDAGFPPPNFYVSIGDEILLVTAVGGVGNTTWTVSRGQEGTRAAPAAAGAAVKFASTLNPEWKQTSADVTAADLSAAPEYFNEAAYKTLFSASYPQSLPYSTGLDALRTYLLQWKLPLWQLRKALLPVGATVAQHAAVAAERYGMNVIAENLVTTSDTSTPYLAKTWNTADFSADPGGLATVPVFLRAASITYESLLELLRVVWVHQALDISIMGIDDTCNTQIQALSPAPLDPGFLDRAHRFLRLWRCSIYKMWELDLLLEAASVGNNALDQNTLIALNDFAQLQTSTGLAVDQLLAFYQDIDTASHRDPDGSATTSLYARTFLNPAVTWVAPDADLAALPANGAIANPKLGDHLPAIQAALGVSGADAAALIALTDNKLTLANLSLIYRVNALAVASKYSISNLLSVAALLNPTAATPANPAGAVNLLLASPAATLAFLAQATDLQHSGLSLDAITYLLTPPSSSIIGGWATATQMTPAAITTTLQAVQLAAKLPAGGTTLAAAIGSMDTSIAVAGDTGLPSPPFYISIGFEIMLVTAVGGTGNTTWTVSRAQLGTAASGALINATVSSDVGGDIIAAVASSTGLAPDVTRLILENLKVPVGGKTLLALLEEPALVAPTGTITVGGVPAAGDTLQTVLTDNVGHKFTVTYALVAADIGHASQSALDFAAAINASAAVAGANAFLAPCTASSGVITLTALTPGAPGSSVTATNTAQPGGVNHVSVTPATTAMNGLPAVTQTSFPNQFLAIQLFDKAGVLVRGLHLVASDLSWLLAHAGVYGGLDFAQLPVAIGQPALSLSPLPTTLLVVKLARLFTAAPPSSPVQTLYDIIGGVGPGGAFANPTAAQIALSIITGWSLMDISAFATALGLVFPGDYRVPATYDSLRILEAMATAASATGLQMVGWGAVPLNEPEAELMATDALSTLKAQQPSNDAWLALAPKLMNPIRDHRSAALQSYLIGHGGYGDSDGLFNYFLIDVQMTSCQVTSRVVQAYIAVQIFVERCLMNLEAPAVVVDLNKDDTWSQWEWVKRYRIWEANREVFLYPENWLIESQRPNRTEIYQKFEQEVRQGQSTTDYLETVVLNYIDRLDGLAHLLVTGTCEDPKTGTIYVVARSLADPPVFYLRSLVKSKRTDSGAWTGWTQIPLDIKAYQVVPALYRGRLCLFWIDVKVSNEPKQQLPAAQPSSSPPSQDVERYVTLGVHFSIFRNGSWAPAQASKGKLFDKPLLNSSSVSDTKSVESLYTIKVHSPAPTAGYGVNLWVDVFRFGDYKAGDIAAAEVYSAAAAATLANAANTSGALTVALDNLAAAFTADAAAREAAATSPTAVHVGRAVFDGRFSDLELNNLSIAIHGAVMKLYPYAQSTYGPDAKPLLPLSAPEKDLDGELFLTPQAGALETLPADPNQGPIQTRPLMFLPASGLDLGPLLLLGAAAIPFSVVGPNTDLAFNPASYFFFQDNRRSYYVESPKYYWRGRKFSPVPPSNPRNVPYEIRYFFHGFYHPFTRLFWNQLAGGGFDLLYDPILQQNPDQIGPSGADVFSFQAGYQPSPPIEWDHDDAQTMLAANISASQTTITVTENIWDPSPNFFVKIGSEILWVLAANKTTWFVARGVGTPKAAALSGTAVVPTAASQDRQFLDFSYSAAFSVYNWELFYHIPLYVAQMLSQNQQFEDAQKWFNYIFNPSRQSTDPVPERFWIPKPLHRLTSAQVIAQQINKLLMAVNQGQDDAVDQVESWRQDPFNPFLLADMRNAAYMKSAVMSYLDNLIAWADNLFSSESREALSEATLIYVIASEILGPTPVAVTPPQHNDQSFTGLEPLLDAFANAWVEIENVVGGAGGSGGGKKGGHLQAPHTFYFKIPSNPQLLGYWTKVADRLYKLRHCQNIAGAPLQLALFDAPIDPGLLIKAQAAGVDLSSVLQNIGAAPPIYRYTSLYPVALDFVNAVRAYGAALQAALEKSDAAALALLQQTLQQQLLTDANQILEWQVEQAQSNIDALNQALALAQQKYNFNNSQDLANAGEITGAALHAASSILKIIAAATATVGAVAATLPDFTVGAAGFGGSPVATITDGGSHAGNTGHMAGRALTVTADVVEIAAGLSTTIGGWQHRKDNWVEAAAEAQIQIAQTNAQIAAAMLALQIAQQNQILHQEQIDNIQKQIDFLNTKFTAESLYDWMAARLSETYFQSYQLAYQMCKQVERCYQIELGIFDSSFIQFGYWDSLHKGLLSGETLSHDLRTMQSSYLQQNVRRYELSRFVSLNALSTLKPAPYNSPLQQLLVTGSCDFTLPESLFDGDYPGHYNRRLVRASVSVVYPSPGKFDNVKATLTLTANQVRVSTDTSSGYGENPIGSDPRFVYNYAANSQKIAMSNAQDDPGLFENQIHYQITDPRYLPFENAGAISRWHLEMPQINNEVDLSTVGDIVLHLYYTALDGGGDFQTVVQADNAANLPVSGIKVFSAQNDFPAPAATAANPYPLTPWQAFLAKPVAIPPAATTLVAPITPSQTSITVASYSGFPPPNFFVSIGSEILQVTAVGGSGKTTWTVARGAQATTAVAATEGAAVMLPAAIPNQILTLAVSPSKFPAWTRGKTISVTSLTVLAVAWPPGPPGPAWNFVLAPQSPLPPGPFTMAPVSGVTEPNVCSATIPTPGNPPLGTWSFELQQNGAPDFRSLTKDEIGDVLLLVSYDAS